MDIEILFAISIYPFLHRSIYYKNAHFSCNYRDTSWLEINIRWKMNWSMKVKIHYPNHWRPVDQNIAVINTVLLTRLCQAMTVFLQPISSPPGTRKHGIEIATIYFFIVLNSMDSILQLIWLVVRQHPWANTILPMKEERGFKCLRNKENRKGSFKSQPTFLPWHLSTVEMVMIDLSVL